jgi:uncharacterized protein YciI
MFIIQLTYKVPLSEVDKYLSAHREYLAEHYNKGLLVASGPLKPRLGGIIIVSSDDKAYIEEEFIPKDPFYIADIADYQVTEFTPIKHCDELKNKILQREGNLC